jgi:uncharacterized membrane protein YqjE
MSLRQTFTQLISSLLLVAGQRFELASLDFEEELLRVGNILAGTLVTALILTLALAAAAATVVTYYWDTSRIYALLGVTGLFTLAGFAMLWRLSNAWRSKPRFMASTLAQLEKDRETIGEKS